MNVIKFVDLFCGIGGIRKGFEKSMKSKKIETHCVLSSEIKKSAIKTYETNYNEKISGNICDIKSDSIEDFDILLAGFPCQAFSTAGKRKGFDDIRGTLFFEVARLLRDKKPSFFLLENVEGLFSHDEGKTLSIIIETLKSLNYSVSYKILDSQFFSMAQSRKRIYIIGSLNRKIDETVFNFDSCELKTFKDIREYNIQVKNSRLNEILREHFEDLYFLAGKSIKDKRGGKNNIHSWDLSLKGEINDQQKEIMKELLKQRRYKKWAKENNTSWLDGIPLSFEQIKTFISSSNLLNNLEDLVLKGYLKKEHPKDIKKINGENNKIYRKDLPIGYNIVSGKLSFEFSNILDDDNIAPTIVATDAIKLGVIEKEGIRTLTEIELKRLFGFDDDFIIPELRKETVFDLFGNSVCVNVVEAIFKNLIN